MQEDTRIYVRPVPGVGGRTIWKFFKRHGHGRYELIEKYRRMGSLSKVRAETKARELEQLQEEE